MRKGGEVDARFAERIFERRGTKEENSEEEESWGGRGGGVKVFQGWWVAEWGGVWG